MAFGVIDYCRQAGLRVPADVSVTGFDDVPVAAMITPRLTTVRQPARDMGYCAAELLFELIFEEPARERPAAFPTTLQIRDSVDAPVR
jgi:DNA-binding LacI/PurR family transcriptional regulator